MKGTQPEVKELLTIPRTTQPRGVNDLFADEIISKTSAQRTGHICSDMIDLINQERRKVFTLFKQEKQDKWCL